MSAPTTGEFLNQTTPAAPTGDQTVIFQSDGATPLQSITAVPKRATGSLFGTVRPDGTSIVIAGGVITALAAGGAQLQTANYTAVTTDAGTLLSFNSPTAVTLTLPAVPPSAKWTIAVQNIGAGVLTIARNGLLIDTAAADLTLNQASGVEIFTDGTNYFTERGAAPAPALQTGCITILFDGGGSVPATGTGKPVQLPTNATITGWSARGDVSGSFSMDLCFHAGSAPPSAPGTPNTTTDKISASAPISMSSAQTASGGATAISTWTTALTQWGSIMPNLTSVTTCKWIEAQVFYTRS